MTAKPKGELKRADPRALATPRSAAVAGILFALLFGVVIDADWKSLPSAAYPIARLAGLREKRDTVTLALMLIPFAGIAFLWFIGVVRDLLGELEDQFFSTVFFGSGLLFLAMMFVSAAVAGGILATELSVTGSGGTSVDTLRFGREVMYQISHNYSTRMAGVFMMSLGTIWYRTGIMPRWLAVLTLVLAIFLLVAFNQNFEISLVLPGWVLLISILILVRNRQTQTQPAPTPET